MSKDGVSGSMLPQASSLMAKEPSGLNSPLREPSISQSEEEMNMKSAETFK